MREQLEALTPEDIADAIAYAVSSPTRLNLAHIVAVPTWQS